MARVCVCCEHPQRTTIEAQLVSGHSLRTVAADFGLKAAALHRHVQNHLSASLRASAQAHYFAAQPPPTPASPNTPQYNTLPELQRVAPDEVPLACSLAARRALQLEEEHSAQLLPSPSQQKAGGSGVPPNETAPATGHSSGAPLDPYALACELRDNAVTILRNASASGDAKLALDANRAAVNVLDRLARLMPRNGGDTASLPLQLSPEWARLRSALMAALEPFPEARIAVAEAAAETGEPQ